MRSSFSAAAICLSLLLTASTAFSQTITASLHSRVSDKSGAVLPNATVTIANVETGWSRSARTDSGGDCQLTLVPVGTYKVTVRAPGFQAETRTLQLTIGATASVEFSLSPGKVEQNVTVTAEAPLVETTRSSTDSVIGEVQIQNLPVNGRQFIDFALLAPGVIVGDTTSGSTDVIIEPVTKLSFAGQIFTSTLSPLTERTTSPRLPACKKPRPRRKRCASLLSSTTPIAWKPDVPWAASSTSLPKAGPMVSTAVVYEYFRNDALDARNILTAPGLNKLRQNQFGATLGGPIKKGRTFSSAIMKASAAMRTRFTTP